MALEQKQVNTILLTIAIMVLCIMCYKVFYKSNETFYAAPIDYDSNLCAKNIPPQLIQQYDNNDRIIPDNTKSHLSGFNERTYNFHLIDSFTTFVNKYERDLQLDWHKDENETLGKIYEKTPPNRVSVSIGLNTEYEGGEFELESWNGRTVRIDKGTAVIFCGSELHKAHPVQQGVRYSLGAWRKGIR